LDQALARQAPYKRRPRIVHAYAYSLAARAMVAGDQGRFDEAFNGLDEAEELTRGPIHPVQGSITSMRTAVYLWQGRWEEALEWAQRNVEVGERMGSRYITAMGIALRGYARWRLDPAADVDAMIRALAWVETTHQAIWTSLHFSWLCEILVATGRHQEARRAAVWVMRRAESRERLGESGVYCALATIAGAAGESSAEHCFARARQSAEARKSIRELALIDLKEASYLESRGERLPFAAERLQGVCDRFSGMGMYGYAVEAQRLERRLSGG
jgi:hypothetical protein